MDSEKYVYAYLSSQHIRISRNEAEPLLSVLDTHSRTLQKETFDLIRVFVSSSLLNNDKQGADIDFKGSFFADPRVYAFKSVK